MAKIFISYRREDSQHQADRLYTALKPHVSDPLNDIFIDIDNIPFGVNFIDYLNGKVEECDALLALIGGGWLEAKNPQTGIRRLDDPKDFVRIEIAAALSRGIPVVPVLLDRAPVPTEEDLPYDLKALAVMNGVPIQRLSFDVDVARLVKGLPIELKQRATDPTPSSEQPIEDSAAAKMWTSIENSLDQRDYEDFRDHYPQSKQAFEARRRARHLSDWAEVDHSNAEAIAKFRRSAADRVPLFPALDAFTEKAMRRAAVRNLRAGKEAAAEVKDRRTRRWVFGAAVAVGLATGIGAFYYYDPLGLRTSLAGGLEAIDQLSVSDQSESELEAAHAPQSLRTLATHAVIMDFGTGEITHAKNEQDQFQPASMVKLMTVYTVLKHVKDEQIALTDRLAVSENAWRNGGWASGITTMGLLPNERPTVQQLLLGLIVVSANDAAIVLAEGIAGSEADFAAEMTKLAEEVGLENTKFANATGMFSSEHGVNAADLAEIMRLLIRDFPEHYWMFSEPRFQWDSISQSNQLQMLGAVPGVDGGKTGHLSESGYSAVLSVVRGEQRRIVVIIGLESSADRAREAERLIRLALQ